MSSTQIVPLMKLQCDQHLDWAVDDGHGNVVCFNAEMHRLQCLLIQAESHP